MLKAILFDSWGTLIETGVFPSPIKQVKYILRIQAPFHEYVTKFEETFMLKKFGSLKEAFESVCTAFDVQPSDFVIDRLIGMWNKNMLLAKPFPDSMETLQKLKKKYKLALVSNTDPFVMEPLLEKFDLRKYFDVVASSYEVGYLKTNPKMFEYVLKKLKVKNQEALMVGDSLQSDIRGAENAGVPAVLLDRRDSRDYPKKITSLSQVEEFLS